MKQFWRIIERYYPWLLLLLGVDCFCFIIFWISDIQAFQTLIGLVVLTSILLFSAILFVLNKRETTRRELFRDFLSDPTICNEERLLSVISREEGESIRLLASVLQEHKNESSSMADALRDYEEYVEGWAHEAKTPLSLLTMLLDNLLDESCIQVAVYDDRLEVTSPGGLYNGLTYEEVMNGHSKIRNKGIANIFSQMGLVEAWGSGIKRILNAAEAYGLSKPRFQEFDNMFRVELFRNSFPMTNEKEDIGETSEKHRRSIGETSEAEWRTDLNDTQQKIIKLLSEDRQLSAVKLAEKIGVASRNIENNIKKLKEYGILIRHGSPKNGYWEIVDKDLQE